MAVLAYKVAYSVLRDHHAAKDVVQETMILYIALRYRPDRAEAWLADMAKKRAINRITSREREKAKYERAARVLLDPVTQREDDQILAKLVVEEALLSLPRQQRRAVTLCDLEDLAYETAAKVMGISVNSLKKHLKRGRTALKKLLRASE